MDSLNTTKPPYVALGIGVATFFINITSISSTSRNGVLTSCSYMDYFALIAGVVLFLYGLNRVFKNKDDATAMLVSLVVVGLGALHVARGLGLVMSPCG